MSILVVFDTKHGFTKRCLDILEQESGAELTLWPLREARGVPNWQHFDRIVMGGPVYYGKFSPPMTKLITTHLDVILAQPCYLFVVGLSPRNAAFESLQTALGTDTLQKFQGRFFFGGAIQWNGLKWWEKILLKRGQGIETDVSNFDLNEIHRLTDALRK